MHGVENAKPNGVGIYPVKLVPSEKIDEDTAARFVWMPLAVEMATVGFPLGGRLSQSPDELPAYPCASRNA